MKLRIQFTKHGAMMYIGHLDTMRYFQKAIRRSGIDIAYTGGFSPHQVMAFAHPLGVGIESDSEILDIEVNSYELLTPEAAAGSGNRQRLISALDAQMSEGFTIRDIRLLPDDAGNAMASVAAASYTVTLRDGICTEEALAAAIDHAASMESMVILKKTKKSELEVDIKPHIYEIRYEDGAVYMCVDASSAGNVKPDAVIGAALSFKDIALPEHSLFVTRKEIFGRTSEGKLKPLIEFGSDF